MTGTSAPETPVGRLGVLGGTFNPPHLGHRELAFHALHELDLDRVLLMPAFRSPFKSLDDDPGPEHRLQMCRLAVADTGRLDVSGLEIERGGPSYTVETLRALRAAHPDVQLTLIVGSDVAGTLTTWAEPRELLALAELAVALRAGCEPKEPQRIRDALGPLLSGSAPYGLRFLRMPVIDISSSSVRERVHRGLAVEELVGSAVATYIAARGLYRGATAEAQAVS